MNLNALLAQYVDPVPYEEPTQRAQQTASSNSGILSNVITYGIIFLLVLLLIGGVVLLVLYIAKKKREEERTEKSLDGILYRVRIAKKNELEVGVAEQMFSNMYSIGSKMNFFQKLLKVNPAISFEILSIPEGIDFYIYSPRKYAKLVENQVLGTYPMAELEQVGEYNMFESGQEVAVAELTLDDDPYQPLRTFEDMQANSISSVLSAMTKVSRGEGIALQVVVSPAGSDWQKDGRSYVENIKTTNSDPEKDRIEVSDEKIQAIEKKCNKRGFQTVIRIVASADNKNLAQARVDGVVGAFDQFAKSGSNSFKKNVPQGSGLKDFMYDFLYRKGPTDKDSILNTEELATIYHLPNEEVEIPLLNWLGFKKAPPDAMVPVDGLWLGTSNYRGVKRDVAMKQKDRRRHMYIVGKTGTGKSYFEQSMILQDIYNGHGVAYMDPHGDGAEWILERIPADRAEDVIYFNAGDRERPVGFNVMEFYSEEDKHMIINAFIGLMYKIFDPNRQGMVGPIFERSVRNVMLTAMSERGSTLVEVVRILTDEQWVKDYWMPKIDDDLVKRYWTDQMAKTDKFHKSEALGYLVSKFDRFVTNALMRHIIGQSESGFDFRDVMDNEKILIVNLSKGLIGDENSQFLGLLMIPKLLSAAMSRADIPEEERKDFYFYVDEFQNFATDSFAQILSEARKYRLNLIVANQYIAQIDEDIRNAVFGNIGSIVSFKVGTDDAEYLEKVFDPVFDKNDLIGIDAINAYVRLLVNDEWPSPFSISTFFNEKKRYPKHPRVEQIVKRLSRMRYGKDINAVRENIARRAQLAVDKAPKGNKGASLLQR